MKITEVSQRCQISADTLRYYERVGLIPVIKRNKSGIRDYSEEDVQYIEFVKCMRGAGLSIDSLITYFDLYNQGDSTVMERKELLLKEREKLESRIEKMQNSLNQLNKKIKMYDRKIK